MGELPDVLTTHIVGHEGIKRCMGNALFYLFIIVDNGLNAITINARRAHTIAITGSTLAKHIQAAQSNGEIEFNKN